MYSTFIKKKLEDPTYYNEMKLEDFKNLVNVICSPNGTGKSMTLRSIEDKYSHCLVNQNKYKWLFNNTEEEAKPFMLLSFSSRNDDISKHALSPFSSGRPDDLSCLLQNFRSEGERIFTSFNSFCSYSVVDTLLKTKDTMEPVVILVDEMDSGLSLDNIYYSIDSFLLVIANEYKRGRNIKVVITSNSYELCEYLKDRLKSKVSYYWLPTKREFKLQTYNKFKQRYMVYKQEYYDKLKEENYVD